MVICAEFIADKSQKVQPLCHIESDEVCGFKYVLKVNKITFRKYIVCGHWIPNICLIDRLLSIIPVYHTCDSSGYVRLKSRSGVHK